MNSSRLMLLAALLAFGLAACRKKPEPPPNPVATEVAAQQHAKGTTLADAYADLLTEPVWEDVVPAVAEGEKPPPTTRTRVSGTVAGTQIAFTATYVRQDNGESVLESYTLDGTPRPPETFADFLSAYYLRRHLAGSQ